MLAHLLQSDSQVIAKLKHKCSSGLRTKVKQSKLLHILLSADLTSQALCRQFRLQQRFPYPLLLLCWIVFAVCIHVGSNHNIWYFPLLNWYRCVAERTHWNLHILRTHTTDYKSHPIIFLLFPFFYPWVTSIFTSGLCSTHLLMF